MHLRVIISFVSLRQVASWRYRRAPQKASHFTSDFIYVVPNLRVQNQKNSNHNSFVSSSTIEILEIKMILGKAAKLLMLLYPLVAVAQEPTSLPSEVPSGELHISIETMVLHKRYHTYLKALSGLEKSALG